MKQQSTNLAKRIKEIVKNSPNEKTCIATLLSNNLIMNEAEGRKIWASFFKLILG